MEAGVRIAKFCISLIFTLIGAAATLLVLYSIVRSGRYHMIGHTMFGAASLAALVMGINGVREFLSTRQESEEADGGPHESD